MEVDQTGLLILAGTIVVVLAFVAFLRYLKTRERLALIEKGLWAPPSRSRRTDEAEDEDDTGRSYRPVDGDRVRSGMITASVGLALTIGVYLATGFTLWIVIGLFPLFIGLGMAGGGLSGKGEGADTISAGLVTSGVGLALTVGLYAAWGGSLVLLIGLLPLTIGLGMALAEWLAGER
ncbi:MAG TPA: DUF6249 domain-containing protein [Limnochordia bacterium]